ncbi:MAG: NADH-quinone oxidoreductase subunit A [Methanomassiliicoccales archaeon]
MLLEKYLPVAVFALVTILFPAIAFYLSRFFRPTKKMAQKTLTYECGEVPIGEAQIQFHFQYYIFGIIFVIFDIITVFLMLWALAFTDLTITAKIYMGIFIVVLLIGLAYALKKEEFLWI